MSLSDSADAKTFFPQHIKSFCSAARCLKTVQTIIAQQGVRGCQQGVRGCQQGVRGCRDVSDDSHALFRREMLEDFR